MGAPNRGGDYYTLSKEEYEALGSLVDIYGSDTCLGQFYSLFTSDNFYDEVYYIPKSSFDIDAFDSFEDDSVDDCYAYLHWWSFNYSTQSWGGY